MRALVCLLLGACMPAAPLVRAPTPTAVAIFTVVDREHEAEVGNAPPAILQRLHAVVEARNLVPADASQSALAGMGRAVRDSERRLEQLRAQTSEALILLVELKATYGSPIGGRYRWDVEAKVSVGRRDPARAALRRSVQLAVFNDHDREREAEALTRAAPAIASLVGALVDELLTE